MNRSPSASVRFDPFHQTRGFVLVVDRPHMCRDPTRQSAPPRGPFDLPAIRQGHTRESVEVTLRPLVGPRLEFRRKVGWQLAAAPHREGVVIPLEQRSPSHDAQSARDPVRVRKTPPRSRSGAKAVKGGRARGPNCSRPRAATQILSLVVEGMRMRAISRANRRGPDDACDGRRCHRSSLVGVPDRGTSRLSSGSNGTIVACGNCALQR